MCTVTYVGQGSCNFVLTSNRDVHASRSPKNLTKTQNLIYGEDTLAGGTWMAGSNEGKIACLLNGAYENHYAKGSYRLSRGIMVLKYFEYQSSMNFIQQFDFEGIEPFTMILIDKIDLIELKWNGFDVSFSSLNQNGQYIWSSSTLYNYAIQKERALWFTTWLKKNPNPGWESIWDFHENGGKKDAWNGFVMNRNGKVQTVSITSMECIEDILTVRYFDKISSQTSEEKFLLN